MSGPISQTQQMRHDDADEADAAADRDRGAGRGGDDEDRHMFQPLHRDAEMAGGRFAERQRVEAARQEGRRRERRQDDRPGGDDLGPGRAGERAELPEGQVAQLPVVGHEDQHAGAAPWPCAPSAMPASSMVAIEVWPRRVETR